MSSVERDARAEAETYWRGACLLSAAHLFGLTWPPPGRPQRKRVVGHWGCNPGIAWVVGNLAGHWHHRDPFLLVVGSGHASSFFFAHRVLSERWDGARISEATARYGQPGGEPAELVAIPGAPYLGGELGPAVAVSQGLAASGLQERLVACIVGDGECETPNALAALAHRDVIFDSSPQTAWLAVVNANGARMGGTSRFRPLSLRRLLEGLGYEVFESGPDLQEAWQAAGLVLAASLAGRAAVWISVTDKGWPAPDILAGHPFRGHHAHKAREADNAFVEAVRSWMTDFDVAGLFDSDGSLSPAIAAVAQRASLGLTPRSDSKVGAASRPSAGGRHGWSSVWREPALAVDSVLAGRGATVFSPDEASSSGLRACLEAGLVREVLAEEVCAAWTWGMVEAGRQAVFVTYEAFAPLAATLLAQYAKMVHSRPDCGRPPLVVVLSSPGWANSPTHQNSDLVGTVLARPWPRMRLLCPAGACSAARRLEQQLDWTRDGLAVVVCSKQPLLDLPDPGGAALEVQLAAGPPPRATVLAIGDVCVTEAVAAAAAAAQNGVGLRVLAVIDAKEVESRGRNGTWPLPGDGPMVGLAWCAPRFMQPLLWEAAEHVFPVLGYQERWGPTAWETLCANRMDRVSLLEELARGGLPFHPRLLRSMRLELDDRSRRELQPGVPGFDPGPLAVASWPLADEKFRPTRRTSC